MHFLQNIMGFEVKEYSDVKFNALSQAKSPKYWTIICRDVCAVYGAESTCYYCTPDLTYPYQKGATYAEKENERTGRLHPHLTCNSNAI